MSRIYLLYRNKDARPLFDRAGKLLELADPMDYCVATSVPAIEIDRLVDVYDMYHLKRDDMPRAATFGDVICYHAQIGMLIRPAEGNARRRAACTLYRILFDLRKAYNPFKVLY